MLRRIAKKELIHAQITLLIAIALQVVVWKINDKFAFIPQYIVAIEVITALLLGFTADTTTSKSRGLHHFLALLLIGLISFANLSSLVFVLNSLLTSHNYTLDADLLVSAVVIFMTNIIVYALWYWEIDSPGLTKTKWTKSDKDFQFTQQNMRDEFPSWRPEFIDYLYLSLTNAVNFAPSDSKPLTRSAKLLMGSQSLISVFILALVIARSVSILG